MAKEKAEKASLPVRGEKETALPDEIENRPVKTGDPVVGLVQTAEGYRLVETTVTKGELLERGPMGPRESFHGWYFSKRQLSRAIERLMK